MKISEFLKQMYGKEVKLPDLEDKEIENFIPKTRFDEINAKNKEYQKNLEEANKKISEIEKFKGTAEEKEKKIKELTEQISSSEKETSKKIKELVLNSQIEKELLENGANKDYIDFLKTKIAKDKIVEDNGNFINLSEQIANLKENKKIMFGSVEKELLGKPPKSGEPVPPTKKVTFEDIDKMSVNELTKNYDEVIKNLKI